MADKGVKSALKDAREHIKTKDYKSALRECKKVLNKDKNNYMALVFCGLSLSELDQPDQALQAYNRAVESQPDQVVAWEGLSKFFEKFSSKEEYKSQHANVLTKLLVLNADDLPKFCDVSSKFAQLQIDMLDLNGAVGTLQKQAEKCKDDKERRKEAFDVLIKVLAQQPVLSDAQSLAFRNALENTITDFQSAQNMENMKHLIKLLYKMREMSCLVDVAVKMAAIFTENIYPLEWVCKVYLEWASGAIEFESEVLKDPSSYYEKLILLSPNSTLGSLAHGSHLWKVGDTSDSVQLLKSTLESNSSPNFYALYILTSAQFEKQEYSAVEYTSKEALKFLDKVKVESVREKMKIQLSILAVKALYFQFSIEKLKSAAELIKDFPIDKKLGLDLNLIMVKIYANLGIDEKVKDLLTLLDDDIPQHERLVIKGMLDKANNQQNSAIAALEQSLEEKPDNFEALILLGQLQWETQNVTASFNTFLKAAKLNPSSWVPFLYLGHYYMQQEGEAFLEKARKCYAKCLQGHPSHPEAGMALSDVYRKQGKLNQNLALLTEVTSKVSASSGRARWAWLRLGVHYLSTDQPTQAVLALQSCLRGDSKDTNCWEALADAYMARGSYNAAIKTFEKVLTLKPDSVYSLLMIAGIKHKLGMWRDAVLDYRELLVKSPDHLPALRGLGESLISLARSFLEEHIDKNAVDCSEEAICLLTKAASLRPSLPGTWRLLGEASALMSVLPSTVARLKVPVKLLEQEGGEEFRLIEKAEVLQLSVRCYIKSLSLSPDNCGNWHDLGLVYSSLDKLDPDSQLVDKSMLAIKKAISLSPRQPQLWTSLGVVAAQREKWALAQHCFIQSLKLETSAVAWTNLGTVYLQVGETQLAHKAFVGAQNLQPDYLRGWAGQALVAEVAESSESMDLFRHCTFLGDEVESGVGYSNWVVSILSSLDKGTKVDKHNKYIIHKMHGVTTAIDSLVKYVLREPEDAGAQCQLGLLMERQGLLEGAAEALERSLALVVGNVTQSDKVENNLGRVYTKLGKYDEAIQHYRSIKNTTFYSQVGLALSYFKQNQLQESYEAYESCLHWLADNDGLKSHILVAMGSLAYRVAGVPAAKTLLFQSCELQPPSVRGLFALCVIGVLNSDGNLVDSALNEMVVHKEDPRHGADIAFLKATVSVLRNDVSGGLRQLLSTAHQQPNLPNIWKVLAVFLLQNCPSKAKTAAAFATKSSHIGRMASSDAMDHASMAHGQALAVLGLLMAGDAQGALRSACRAAHMFPDLAQIWALVVAALRQNGDMAKGLRLASHTRMLASREGNELLENWAGEILK